MKVSFVLPVYNQQSSISRAIQSLVNQTIEDKEVIVINDCSDDNTRDLVEWWNRTGKIKATHMNIRRGAASCRNLGNTIATGDIIAVCDADQYYKDRGKAIVEFFTQFPDKDIFYSALHLRDSKNPYETGLMEAYEWDFNSKCPISHPTVAYRKKVATEVKYLEKSLDTDLYEFFLLECHKKGYQFDGCQNPLMIKIEGNSKRKTEEAKILKKELYKEYGIEI